MAHASADPTIAVVGAGNGGQCMAADLSLQGYDVVLYEIPELADRLAPVAETRRIELRSPDGTATAELAKVTFDIADALVDATIVCVVAPAFAHDRLFSEMLPFLRDEHTVILWAADFGSLALRHLIEISGRGIDPTIIETNTLPYGVRLMAPGKVNLLLTAPLVKAAALPAHRTMDVVGSLRRLWSCLEVAPDVLSAAMSNPNPIVHPAGSLLNTGWIQQARDDFFMYRVGITEAVARVIHSVYSEIRSVARALGTDVIEYDDRDFQSTGSIMAIAFQAPFDTLGVIASVAGPKSVHDRYVTEDLPYGLVPVSQLGKLVGVTTPAVDGLIDLGSIVCDEDFRANARGLDQLGLEGLGPDEIMRSVRAPIAERV